MLSMLFFWYTECSSELSSPKKSLSTFVLPYKLQTKLVPPEFILEFTEQEEDEEEK